jgi:hypothetical protein
MSDPALAGPALSAASPDTSLAGQMAAAAGALLATLDEEQREACARPFADDGARRWLEYRPEPRPGACLAGFSLAGRKAAHQLLATGLSDHAFAQAMAITALEEVLDRREAGRLRRHSGDYWVAVFGHPAGNSPWSWRFEGHHVSVTMTIAGQHVSPAPIFLGANPDVISYAGQPVSRPLGPEQDLARAFLDTLDPAGRALTVVSGQAPADIRSARDPQASALEPAGVPESRLGLSARAALRQLTALYLDRLPPELAAAEAVRIEDCELAFAWEGPLTPGSRHYYRVQADDLLIEYDSTDDANHAHTVLRRPRSDFGSDLLAAHLREAHA